MTLQPWVCLMVPVVAVEAAVLVRGQMVAPAPGFQPVIVCLREHVLDFALYVKNRHLCKCCSGMD